MILHFVILVFLFKSVVSSCPSALSEKCCRIGSYGDNRCIITENIKKLNRSAAESACDQFPNGHLAEAAHVNFTLLRTRNLIIENVGYFLAKEGHFGPAKNAEERFICEYEEPEKLDCDCAKKFSVISLIKSFAKFRIRRKPKTTTTSTTTTTTTTTTTPCTPKWSEWSDWSKCDGGCGACHMNNRTRICETERTCPCSGEPIEEDYCGIMVCLWPKKPCCKPHKVTVVAHRPACGPQPHGDAIAKREYKRSDASRTIPNSPPINHQDPRGSTPPNYRIHRLCTPSDHLTSLKDLPRSAGQALQPDRITVKLTRCAMEDPWDKAMQPA